MEKAGSSLLHPKTSFAKHSWFFFFFTSYQMRLLTQRYKIAS